MDGNRQDGSDDTKGARILVVDDEEVVHASLKRLLGRQGHEVDAVARRLVQRRVYPGYPHGLGHQVGRNAHDGGTILGPLWERYGDTPNGVVEAENVFTLELHVPTEHFGPISLEEDIVVTEKGSRFLSRPQEALICLR